VLVFKGQQIRFLGIDGEKRAAAFASEFTGLAEAKGNVVKITARELNIGARKTTISDFVPAGALSSCNGTTPRPTAAATARNRR
jgi:hypothetical protein